MDFLKAYGVTINLKTDTVSLGAGALIQQITESVDRIPVRLRADCSLLTGHLNRCRQQVDDATLSGVYLFEAGASSLRDELCQFEAQVVEVRDGLTDLYVEHPGAGPSLRMRRGEVLGELRVLGATEVHTPKRFDPVTPCHALYALLPCPKDYPRTTDSADSGTRDATDTVDTGVNRPVKQPPRRTSFVEKEQIEANSLNSFWMAKSKSVSRPGLLLCCSSRKKTAAGGFALIIVG